MENTHTLKTEPFSSPKVRFSDEVKVAEVSYL